MLDTCQERMKNMNKEEILTKSRKENELSDERGQRLKLQGADFSIGVLIFSWIVISHFTPLDLSGKLAIALLTQITCLSNFAYQLIRNMTKTNIFFTIIFTCTSLLFLYQFLSNLNIISF